MRTFRTDLYADEVYVFTPKGEVKSLPAGSTPIDFAYAVHTDVGHRTVGAKVNGRIVPLHYQLKSGDFVEILTSKQLGPGPVARLALDRRLLARAQQDPPVVEPRDPGGHRAARARVARAGASSSTTCPYKKIAGSPLLAGVIREMNFKKAEDFYLALGSGKLQVSQVVEQGAAQAEDDGGRGGGVDPAQAEGAARRRLAGRRDHASRASRTCSCGSRSAATPFPATTSAATSRSARASPSTATTARTSRRSGATRSASPTVEWDGGATQSFRVQIAVDSWDRPRLLEDVARTFAEHGANIVEYSGHVEDQMAKNWYVAEIGDVKALRALLERAAQHRVGVRRVPRNAVVTEPRRRAPPRARRARTRRVPRRLEELDELIARDGERS